MLIMIIIMANLLLINKKNVIKYLEISLHAKHRKNRKYGEQKNKKKLVF